MTATTGSHAFQAEVKQLLDLMVHSLYTNKDVFLRELVSNASDALDKLRFEGLSRPELLPEGDLEIRLLVDTEKRTLAVRDNGIGMSREEVFGSLGTIARSGTQDYLKALGQRSSGDLPPELIGQFGVGFYASFMVAERVTVITRRAGEEAATRWESTGDGEFEVHDAERDETGTTVLLALKEPDPDDALQDYTSSETLRGIVKRYSDFVSYPVLLETTGVETTRDDAGDDTDDDADDDSGSETAAEPAKPLNSMKAIWTRPREDVSDEEYAEFYKHVSHDWADPLEVIPATIEGTFEARALLFIPSTAPIDLYWREQARRGVQLHVKRVFIMDDCKELLPDHLRFVRGVVDAEDLSLNVSREMLQQDRQVRTIRKFLVKKVLDALETMLADDRDKYERFWKEFGPVLKEGLASAPDDRERLQRLILCSSSHDPEALTTLSEYVERMKDGQECIYHVTARDRAQAERSPHLEAFREQGYEVLYLTDPVDELWVQGQPTHDGKSLQSVGQGEVELGDEKEREERAEERQASQEKFENLLSCLAKHLEDDVKEVRLSGRLSSSAACLVGDVHDVSPGVADMMRRMGQDVPEVKRTLEVNPKHPLLERLGSVFEADAEDPQLADIAQVLFGQALLAEGRLPKDPVAYGELVARISERALS